MVKIMEKVSAANNLLIGVFIVSFIMTFIILLDFQEVSIDVEKANLSQINLSGKVDRVAGEADIPARSVSKNISSTGKSATNPSNTSDAMGNNEVSGITHKRIVPDNSNSKSLPLTIRPNEAQDLESHKSTLSAEVSPMNISIQSARVSDSSSAKATSSEASSSSKDSLKDSKSDANDRVDSPDPHIDQNSISDLSDQRALDGNPSPTDTRPPHWQIYQQRRLAICNQLIDKWKKSGKSLYQLDRRTRLLMTSSYRCL